MIRCVQQLAALWMRSAQCSILRYDEERFVDEIGCAVSIWGVIVVGHNNGLGVNDCVKIAEW